MKTNDNDLGDLYDAVITNLTKKLKDGSATAADLSVARALLRDANIQPPKGVGHPAEKLASALPFSAREDGADDEHQTH